MVANVLRLVSYVLGVSVLCLSALGCQRQHEASATLASSAGTAATPSAIAAAETSGAEAAKALAAAERAAAAAPAAMDSAMPAGHPPVEGGAVHGQPAPRRAAGDVVAHGPVGEVLEALPADRYTYLRLKTTDGEVWAAVGGDAPAVGAQVAIVEALRMEQFHSAALERTFAVLWLGRVSTNVPAAERAAAGEAKALPTAAAGEQAIATVRSQAKALAGQRVRVRGRVEKVTRRVLGKDWLHLRDQSVGEAGAALVVTTQTAVEVGAIVVLEGTLAVDHEIGAGYRYDVLLQDATPVE